MGSLQQILDNSSCMFRNGGVKTDTIKRTGIVWFVDVCGVIEHVTQTKRLAQIQCRPAMNSSKKTMKTFSILKHTLSPTPSVSGVSVSSVSKGF